MTYYVTGYTETGEWLDEVIEADSVKDAYTKMDLKLSLSCDMTCPSTSIVPVNREMRY